MLSQVGLGFVSFLISFLFRIMCIRYLIGIWKKDSICLWILELGICTSWRSLPVNIGLIMEGVWWLWMMKVVGASCFGSGLMYQLLRRIISLAKSYIGRERMWSQWVYRVSIFPIVLGGCDSTSLMWTLYIFFS